MRILRPIVEPTADLVRSAATLISFIAAEYARSPSVTMLRGAPVLHHYPLEKLQRRRLVPLRRDDRRQDLALMIDRAPEVAKPAVDLHERMGRPVCNGFVEISG
jgi:hypothetical protein